MVNTAKPENEKGGKMTHDLSPQFEVRLAVTDAEKNAGHRLRYDVFVAELGGDGPLVDHQARTEQDAFDPYMTQLILYDHARSVPEGELPIVGVYRLFRDDQAALAGRFYSEDEYDLTPLKASGKRLLELGRSCVAADYRGGAAMFHLWAGLAQYIQDNNIEVLFGVASFHGTDVDALAAPLSFLHHRHLAPPELRPRVLDAHFTPMDRMPADAVDRAAALKDIPALIKAYLRLGGYVGEGAFVDHPFNTTDVCLILETARISAASRAIYTRDRTG